MWRIFQRIFADHFAVTSPCLICMWKMKYRRTVAEDHPHVCIYSLLLRILFATCSHFSSLRPLFVGKGWHWSSMAVQDLRKCGQRADEKIFRDTWPVRLCPGFLSLIGIKRSWPSGVLPVCSFQMRRPSYGKLREAPLSKLRGISDSQLGICTKGHGGAGACLHLLRF